MIKHFILDIYSDFISAAAPQELSIDKAINETSFQNILAVPADSIESNEQAGNIKYSSFQGTNCELSTIFLPAYPWGQSLETAAGNKIYHCKIEKLFLRSGKNYMQ